MAQGERFDFRNAEFLDEEGNLAPVHDPVETVLRIDEQITDLQERVETASSSIEESETGKQIDELQSLRERQVAGLDEEQQVRLEESLEQLKEKGRRE